jgi:hypothetical protein
VRPEPGTNSPRPARGQLESCLISGTDGLHEVWCHPDDTAELLQGVTVNGVPCHVELVDRLAYADTLRFTEQREPAATLTLAA